MPDAFWHRKKYWVSLRYEKTFDEENIPSTSQVVPMNERMRAYCKQETCELQEKGLIQQKISSWGCFSFYVNKHLEKVRGTPRMVINYKPMNEAL